MTLLPGVEHITDYLFFFLAVSFSMWDLSSLNGGIEPVSPAVCAKSYTLDHQGSPITNYLESSSNPDMRCCVSHVTDEDMETQTSKNLVKTSCLMKAKASIQILGNRTLTPLFPPATPLH